MSRSHRPEISSVVVGLLSVVLCAGGTSVRTAAGSPWSTFSVAAAFRPQIARSTPVSERDLTAAIDQLGEVDEPALHRCALVAARYGADASAGAVGVIGPSRMDYGRVMTLVDYFARSLTEKLSA